MGAFLDKLTSNALEPRPGSDPVATGQPQRPRVLGDTRFTPARWLVMLLAMTRLVFKGGRLGKLGIAGLVWSVTPRKLKIAAAGLAVATAIVVFGAVAAITLLALQLS